MFECGTLVWAVLSDRIAPCYYVDDLGDNLHAVLINDGSEQGAIIELDESRIWSV